MNQEEQKQAERLATEHWNWLESVLAQQREMERKLFIDSFIHAYKHGIDDKEKQER